MRRRLRYARLAVQTNAGITRPLPVWAETCLLERPCGRAAGGLGETGHGALGPQGGRGGQARVEGRCSRPEPRARSRKGVACKRKAPRERGQGFDDRSGRKLKAQRRLFTGTKREMGDGETAVGKERDNPGRSLELSHFEPAPRGIHPCSHQHLSIAGWIDTLHDPKAVPARSLSGGLLTEFDFEQAAMFQALPQALLADDIRGKLDLVGH